MTTDLDTYLASLPGRCRVCGHHIATQGCRCPGGEWAIFTAAIRSAGREDGTVHQADVRPLIRGRIAPKHIGLCWKRARREGFVVEVDHERSDDTAGRNAHRLEAVYELRGLRDAKQTPLRDQLRGGDEANN